MVKAMLSLWFMLWAALAFAAEGEARRHGLMWNRTGLPAVFPLQVKTAVGQDYLLQLTDRQTGDTALAAYIEGGRFFRVLVPPGTYDVHFAYGAEWRGEAMLFGADGQTKTLSLAAPLTFAVRNFDVKGGHVLDLKELAPGQDAQIRVAPQMLCQSYRFAQRLNRWRIRSFGRLPDTPEFFATPLDALEAELDIDLVHPFVFDKQRHAHRRPQLTVWTRSC